MPEETAQPSLDLGSSSAPAAEAPAPVDSGPVAADVPVEREAPSATGREAVERAFDKILGKEGAERPQGDRSRDEFGRFKPTEQAAKPAEQPQKQPQQAQDAQQQPQATADRFAAPERFSAAAKAEWAKVPEVVRAETQRAIGELTTGIRQYQEAFAPYKDFDAQLRANGQNFQDVLSNYVGIEQLLVKDPVEGLDRICRNMGLTLQQVAEHVLGQPPEQAASRDAQIIAELRQQVSQLAQGVNGITQAEQERRYQTAMQEVTSFAAQNPRLEELSSDIKFFLETGRAQTLQQAYDLATRLNPAPAQVYAAQPPAAPAQNGQRPPSPSISGSPTPGSNPRTIKPAATPREALERTFSSLGI